MEQNECSDHISILFSLNSGVLPETFGVIFMCEIDKYL